MLLARRVAPFDTNIDISFLLALHRTANKDAANTRLVTSPPSSLMASDSWVRELTGEATSW